MVRSEPTPRSVALDAMRAVSTLSGEVQPTTTVRYESAGRTLVLGEHASALTIAASLAEPLEPYVLLPPNVGNVAQALRTDVPCRNAELVSLSGHLGRFEGNVWVDGRAKSLSELMGLGSGTHFDLVLDLQERPYLTQETLPLGYQATRGNDELVLPAIEAIRGLVGAVEKPKFFAYDPDLCAHEGRGLPGCRLCIDACSTDAIRSVGERIEVDPFLCQGQGSCSTVCPSGAIAHIAPPLSLTLERMSTLLHAFLEAGGRHPSLLIHDAHRGTREASGLLEECGEHVLPLEVDRVAAVGMEAWLAALASGAEEVVLLIHDEVPPKTRQALEEQVGFARGLLAGLGLDVGAIALVSSAEAQERFESPRRLDGLSHDAGRRRPPPPMNVGGKREALFAAIDALHALASQPLPEATLRAGAPFGEVVIESSRCVLCMACVTVCPSHALVEGRDRPTLIFHEERCVQCGLCKTACPQDAVTLSARYLFDASKRNEPRVLHEEEPFECIVCGQPFATRSLIETVIERLKEHNFLESDDQIERMKRCERCRASDRPHD